MKDKIEIGDVLVPTIKAIVKYVGTISYEKGYIVRAIDIDGIPVVVADDGSVVKFTDDCIERVIKQSEFM